MYTYIHCTGLTQVICIRVQLQACAFRVCVLLMLWCSLSPCGLWRRWDPRPKKGMGIEVMQKEEGLGEDK